MAGSSVVFDGVDDRLMIRHLMFEKGFIECGSLERTKLLHGCFVVSLERKILGRCRMHTQFLSQISALLAYHCMVMHQHRTEVTDRPYCSARFAASPPVSMSHVFAASKIATMVGSSSLAAAELCAIADGALHVSSASAVLATDDDLSRAHG